MSYRCLNDCFGFMIAYDHFQRRPNVGLVYMAQMQRLSPLIITIKFNSTL